LPPGNKEGFIWSFAKVFLAFWQVLPDEKSSLVDLPENNALNLPIFSYSWGFWHFPCITE
jgi:hypothetical protein